MNWKSEETSLIDYCDAIYSIIITPSPILWRHIFKSVTNIKSTCQNEPIFIRAAKYLLNINLKQYGKLYRRMQPSFNKNFKYIWITSSIGNLATIVINTNHDINTKSWNVLKSIRMSYKKKVYMELEIFIVITYYVF